MTTDRDQKTGSRDRVTTLKDLVDELIAEARRQNVTPSVWAERSGMDRKVTWYVRKRSKNVGLRTMIALGKGLGLKLKWVPHVGSTTD